MGKEKSMRKHQISGEMTVLDVVSEHEAAIEVFRRYDAIAGECICCCSLFDSIEGMAARYGIDAGALLWDLNHAIAGQDA